MKEQVRNKKMKLKRQACVDDRDDSGSLLGRKQDDLEIYWQVE